MWLRLRFLAERDRRDDSRRKDEVSPCGMPINIITHLKKGIVFSVGSDPYTSSEYEDDRWSALANMFPIG